MARLHGGGGGMLKLEPGRVSARSETLMIMAVTRKL